jgi:hypothetical protein
MPDLKGTTRAQTIFLRAFRNDPAGPPAEQWPSAMVLRRWLRREGFAAALGSLMQSLRYQADFHLTAAAAAGAHLLHDSVRHGDVDATRKQIEALIALQRMAHIRHRFAEPLPQARSTIFDFIDFLRHAHPDITVRDALRHLDVLNGDEDGKPSNCYKSFWTRAGQSYPASEVADVSATPADEDPASDFGAADHLAEHPEEAAMNGDERG